MPESTGRILVVDDNRMNRLTLARSLEQQGHAVTLAEHGAQALELLTAESFDVVLLDIVMPEMDGYEVLSRIKADPELKHIPVIVISALDELDSVVRCIEMGAEDYLTKPFNSVLLNARLDSSLRRKRLRDLEQMYLKQEFALRQNEKLATLGRLAAGMAHELNNPAAAVQRGVKQMSASFEQHLTSDVALGSAPGNPFESLLQAVQARKDHRSNLDPLERSDRESEINDWLDAHGVLDGWEAAPELVNMGLDSQALERALEGINSELIAPAVTWLTSGASILSLVDEACDAVERIVTIVKSLKTYTYLDRAPVQNVDIHEGLESTLVMMRGRLGRGVKITRDYAPSLPRIEAYSSELNQVWTNLIDNAAAAMGGEGELTIRTHQEGEEIVVEVSDTGPGIAPESLPLVFDPFFTTKPMGEGTGLGLNISHNIIVDKHRGEISVTSVPGNTTFTVKVPLSLPVEGKA